MLGSPDPVAFTIGGMSIRWYGVLIAVGMLLAVYTSMIRAPRHNIEKEDLLDTILFAIPAGILGARLYYVAFNWSYYGANPSQILNFRGGGLAIHGGLIAGMLVAWLVCRHKKINILNALDLAIPGIALAQSIGRWGNYFNSEAHGGPTDLPWGIMVDGVKVHPTFLYESIWCFILFIVLIILDKKPHFQGKIVCLYGILYSLERFLVEGLRTDSLMLGPFKQAQLLSLTVIVVCIVAYVYLRKSDKEN